MVENLGALDPVKAFDVGILVGLARFGVDHEHAVVAYPIRGHFTEQLAAMIKAVMVTEHTNIWAVDVPAILSTHRIMLYRWRQEMWEGKLVDNEEEGRSETKLAEANQKVRELDNELKLLLTREPVDAPCQVWVGDTTYIRVGTRWTYLSVVMDLYTREIIGWSLGKQHSAPLVCDALRMAFAYRQPEPDAIFHSDHGTEYVSNAVRDVLFELGP